MRGHFVSILIELTKDHHAMLNNEILQLMDDKVKQARRHNLEDMNEFRKTSQQVHLRRDFDLYNPNALIEGSPARLGDDDPRIGISSLQRFEGEDLGVMKREELQKEQMRVWTHQQLFEKKTANEALANEKLYKSRLILASTKTFR